ncbi:hypothetical protein JOE55_000460 [Kocuria palustris]|nr:hypothetical protein [Kocuria palustris]
MTRLSVIIRICVMRRGLMSMRPADGSRVDRLSSA